MITKRDIRFFWQRLTRGWDDSETWNLDARISEHILPRLKRFKQITKCYPPLLTPNEWDGVLDKMIFAHAWCAEDCATRDENEETFAKVREGIELFGKYYCDLWW